MLRALTELSSQQFSSPIKTFRAADPLGSLGICVENIRGERSRAFQQGSVRTLEALFKFACMASDVLINGFINNPRLTDRTQCGDVLEFSLSSCSSP